LYLGEYNEKEAKMSPAAKVIELNAERVRRDARVAAERALLLLARGRVQSPALGRAPVTAELVWLSMSAQARRRRESAIPD
jgi:hypothetical protein